MCNLSNFGEKILLIQNKLKGGSSAPTPDKRGVHTNKPHKLPDEVVNCIIDHIKQFPVDQSHYSRNKNIYKKYLSPLLNVQKMFDLYIESCQQKNIPEKYFIKKCSYNNIFFQDTSFNHLVRPRPTPVVLAMPVWILTSIKNFEGLPSSN